MEFTEQYQIEKEENTLKLFTWIFIYWFQSKYWNHFFNCDLVAFILLH